MSRKKIAGGVFVPIVTPFDDNENVDIGAFRAIVEYQIASGVAGLLVTGTNGEAWTLDFDERRRLYEAAVRQADGRATIFAGTGATTTREAVRLTALAADCGCDGAVVLTPWFINPSIAGLERYYAELADSARLPLLFYHNPPVTKLDWPAEAVGDLAVKLAGRVIGIKDSANDSRRVEATRATAPPGFVIYAGTPQGWAEFAAAGADGCIDAVANALPAEAVAACGGDARAVAVYGAVSTVLRRSRNMLALMKRLMVALGLPAGAPRRPRDLLDPNELEQARQEVSRGGRLAAGDAAGGDRAPADVEHAVHMLAPGAVARCRAGPPVRASTCVLYQAGEGDWQYSHHAAIAKHQGRFFAAWSNGRINEDSPGQVVRFAVSEDGTAWTSPALATPAPEGMNRWTCGGLWVRGGTLYLLATRYTRARYVEGELTAGVCWEDLATEAFAWDGGRFVPAGLALADFYANEAPRPLPDGRWLWPGVNSRHDPVLAVGGQAGIDDWRTTIVASRADGFRLSEPSWYLARDGSAVALFRDDGGSRRLFVSVSRDDGASWSRPTPTDFSDAQSKFRALNLPDGRVALVCNPAGDDTRRRLLAVAVSPDGQVFDRLVRLHHDEQARARLPGMHKAAGFQYPNAVVADGRLLVVCSANKEDILLTVVDLKELG